MPTVAPLDLDAHCVSVAWLNDLPHFALADGVVHRLDGGHRQVSAHDGLLAAAVDMDGGALVTGGEDGNVRRIFADGRIEDLAFIGRRWVTSVACGPRGAVAWAHGRSVHVRLPDGQSRELVHKRSVEAIAFSPKGMRLAVARYNGVSLHFPAVDGLPTELEWAGAHMMVAFSPDAAFLVTSMQENALHGWRLADHRHMRMTGYPAKVKSMSWAAKGRWLASSGAPAAIVWPFQGKDGPMGKAPVELGTRGNVMVTAVCGHPTEEFVAIGYDDGMVLAARIGDQKEVLLRREGKSALTAMAWDRAGKRLAFGSEGGECGVIDISA